MLCALIKFLLLLLVVGIAVFFAAYFAIRQTAAVTFREAMREAIAAGRDIALYVVRRLFDLLTAPLRCLRSRSS